MAGPPRSSSVSRRRLRPPPQRPLLPLLAALLCACGDGGGGAQTPAAAAYVRDCIAQARPVQRIGMDLEPVFVTLRFAVPVALVQAPGDAERWYVAERAGRVLRVDAPAGAAPAATEVLDLGAQVSTAGEGGLLGLAFHPDYPARAEVYLSYTAPGAPLQSRLARYRVAGDGRFIDGEVLLAVDQPYSNHNGGWIGFGPDGRLYYGLGDGGSAGDPLNSGQDTSTLLGAMLRLDVDSSPQPGKAYAVPPDNVFAPGGSRPGQGAPEIYAWGLRNPWRWSFDPATGALWLGDVGQGAWEEVDKIVSGANYGWRCYEGSHPYDIAGCADAGAYAPPVAEYPHEDGNCSITGGYVYRGSRVPDLAGVYLFGDFCSGRIWGLADGGLNGPVELLDTPYNIAGFAQDNAGEVYVLHLDDPGAILRVVPGRADSAPLAPDRLSQTGCADPQDPARPSAALRAYEISAPFWADGAAKQRWLALPPGARITVEAELDWTLPVGSVLRKDFRLDGRLVETRLFMRHRDGEWAGYSFEWNAAQTEARLLGTAKELSLGGQAWHYPSPNECAACHTAAAGRSLGLETAQLNLTLPGGGNQLQSFEQAGLFSAPLPAPPGGLPSLADPAGGGPPAQRARAYLHTNCSQCHRPGGPTPVGGMDLRYDTVLADMGICNVPPQAGDLGIAGARLLAPGDPARSVLLARMSRRDGLGMPPLASLQVDAAGAALTADWISAVSACP